MILKILHPQDKNKVKSYIDSLSSEKRYIVEIKVKREQRSIDQNRLYWLWLNCIMDETGEHRDDLHEFFKVKFLGVTDKEVFGQKFCLSNTTTKLDTKEFTNYIERVRQFSNVEIGIVLPDPEDLHWEEFYEKYKNYI